MSLQHFDEVNTGKCFSEEETTYIYCIYDLLFTNLSVMNDFQMLLSPECSSSSSSSSTTTTTTTTSSTSRVLIVLNKHPSRRCSSFVFVCQRSRLRQGG